MGAGWRQGAVRGGGGGAPGVGRAAAEAVALSFEMARSKKKSFAALFRPLELRGRAVALGAAAVG